MLNLVNNINFFDRIKKYLIDYIYIIIKIKKDIL